MDLGKVIDALEKFAPLPLQDDYDNSGLQIGLTAGQEVTGALLCLDVTPAVIDQAIACGANLIVSHHPILFHSLKTVSDSDYTGGMVMKAIKNNIAVYSAHTSLDNAPGGVSYKMAQLLGLQNVKVLDPICNAVRENAGSGVIGQWENAVPLADALDRIKRTFSVECVRYAASAQMNVKTVALCGGAGDFLTDKAKALGADMFVVGEAHYHRFLGLDSMALVEIGHYESELCSTVLLQDILHAACPQLETRIAHSECPVRYLK